ncbi:response regulator transcription factor [Pseudactinotalea suaedae]|jgi:DNA-binding NarL/FixJ family response regulator|uniref:response regulator n=1 Tax=Pseudactinotalea suaedae TaxID=1524924 RepID=UPI0012E1D2B7
MHGDITVMVIDDHEIVRRGVAEVIDRADGLTVVGEAATVAEALRRLPLASPQVILVDLQLPDGTGLEVIAASRALPDCRAVVLTSFEDADALRAAGEAGAHAFLLKTVRGDDIADAVRAVAAGRSLMARASLGKHEVDPTERLTPSEHRVLELIGDGLSNREIGEVLGVAEKTVKNHVTGLLAKMGLQRRTQAAAWVAGHRGGGWRPRTDSGAQES